MTLRQLIARRGVVKEKPCHPLTNPLGKREALDARLLLTRGLPTESV
jgi:hypothetical protein